MSLPLVSVIIPTFNYVNYILEAIDSVLSNSYPKELIEIIVVDDGSADNTKHVLQPYIDNGHIKYFYQENKGKASATSFAIEKTKGKYIFNLDADDYFLTNKILHTINIFETNDSIVHVASPARIINEENQAYEIEKIPADIIGKPVHGNWLLEYFYNSNILYGGGTTYAARTSILKTIKIPDAVDMYIDEFLILAILPLGKSYFIKEPLSVWRVHGDNYSLKKNSKEYAIFKTQRLLKSSFEMLSFLEHHNYDPMIVKIYKLKNLTRLIAFKENVHKKRIIDILNYAYNVFVILRPNWKQIKNYHVINRLIPTDFLQFLKNCRRLTNKSIVRSWSK
jgi:glycosyltransferase involved in cell wall biosynthesis